MKVIHTLKPIYDNNSKVLILGSMPSIKSRELNFYYANPNNRFWSILEILFETNLTNNKEKEDFLHENHIALYLLVTLPFQIMNLMIYLPSLIVQT